MLKSKVKQNLLSTAKGRWLCYNVLFPLIKGKLALKYIWDYRILKRGVLSIEPTTKCNLSCEYCGRGHSIENNYRDVGDISKHDLETVLVKFGDFNPLNIAFTGLGEPTLYPDIGYSLSLIRKQYPQSIIAVNTNGIRLTKDISKSFIDNRLDFLTVSINILSSREYIKKVGADKLKTVIANIRDLLEIKQKSKSNKPAVNVQLFKKYDDKISKELEILEPYKELYSLRVKNTHNFFGYRNLGAIKKRHPCHLTNTITIDKDGYVYPCCGGLYYGHNSNLNIGTIQDPYSQLQYRAKKLQDLHKRGKWIMLGECKNCDSWRDSPSVYFKIPFVNRWV